MPSQSPSVRLSVGLLLASTMVALPAASAELKVVATSKPIHALVAGVMGATGAPKLLVDGTASVHTFAMRPSDSKAVHEAAVLFRVSETLEPFTAKLVKALPKTVRVVSLQDAPGIALLDRRAGGLFETHGHAGHKDHDHGEPTAAGKDGHIWLDPDNAQRMVDHIAATLVTANAADAAAYTANAQALKGQIASLATEIQRDIDPVKGRPFIVFHDAIQYFEKRFGIVATGSITLSPDVQPSAKRLTAIRKKLASVQAACVFAEPQFTSKLVDTVVEGTPARRGTLDPEGALLAPGPGLYAALMRGLATSLKACLGSSS